MKGSIKFIDAIIYDKGNKVCFEYVVNDLFVASITLDNSTNEVLDCTFVTGKGFYDDMLADALKQKARLIK